MSRTKILYISHSSEIAGAEVCLLTLVKHIDKELFEPVVVFSSEGPLKKRIDGLGVKTRLSPLEWWIRSSGCSETVLSDRVRGIEEIIEEERPAIVHTNTSVIWEGALAAKEKGVPHLWHVHEKLKGHPSLIPILPLNIVFMLMDMLSEKVVAVSNYVGNGIREALPAEKVVIVHNGIGEDRQPSGKGRASLREELGVGGALLAVTIGSLVREKGHDVLLKAAEAVMKSGADVRFVIAGGGGPDVVNLLEKEIEEKGLKDTVSYIGFRDDVPDILNAADLLILPSRTDAFPTVVLEAMAAGKAVLATECGGPQEMITNGENGFLVPIEDPQALAMKIIELSADRERLEPVGKAALKSYIENFTAKVYARRFEEVYTGILRDYKAIPLSDKDKTLVYGLMEIYSMSSVNLSEIKKLDRQLAELCAEQNRQLSEIFNSYSWKITAPMRSFWEQIRRTR